MRDYIILNGVNSNTITGLLISTLPPITKPKIRTQTEEIDGRDGDIITKLGYSAYDKEIEIGLYGDFDIDDVIAYFNSEGTVTFSNEPDKFYNYQILDQIDYEKLIRFKKAKIKMHIQPFKYPLEETPVEITIQTVNNEAEEIDLDNTKEAPMTIALKGNTSQNTTTGKNLLNFSDYDAGYNSTTYTSFGNHINIKSSYGINTNVKASGNTYRTTMTNTYDNSQAWQFTGLEPNTQYTVSCNISTNRTAGTINIFSQSLNYTATYKVAHFTTDENGDYQYTLMFYMSGSKVVGDYVELSNIQLEKGSTATAYEPYTNGASPNPDYPQDVHIVTGDNIITIENSDSSENQNYHITLPEGTELCKIGDYQDRIYKDSGKWYIEKQIGKEVLDGTKSIGTQNDVFTFSIEGIKRENTYGSSATILVLSNQYTGQKTDYRGSCKVNHIIKTTGANNQICWNDTRYTATADMNTWFTSNPATVYYVLAEPTTTEITDETLIAQLEALKNASSYDTKTHITQNSNDKPFILNATALQQGSGEATVNNEGNIYSKPTLDIEGTGTVGIYLDGNQIFSIDLSNSSECVIDTTQLEAYNPTTSELMNRQVTGDYSNFKLNAGDNQIQATGDITKVTISNYTRWL